MTTHWMKAVWKRVQRLINRLEDSTDLIHVEWQTDISTTTNLFFPLVSKKYVTKLYIFIELGACLPEKN